MATVQATARLTLISIFLLLALALAVRADDWPQWLGPTRNGGTLEKVAAWKNDAPPKVLWRKAVGGAYSSPVIAGGKVYVHTGVREKDAEEVIAFDLATGEVAWKDEYSRPRYRSILGSGPRATPTVSGNQLFTIGINGVLSCYDLESGNRTWQVNLFDKFQAQVPRYAVCCSPLVIGNRVIVSVGGSGRCVVALDTKTGETAWQSLDDATSTSSAVLFAGGERQPGASPDVVFLTPLRLVGLDPLDGTLRWEHPMVFQPQGTSPTPIAIGDKLVTSTQAHGAIAVQIGKKGDALAANAAWQDQNQKSYFSSGVAVGDLVLLVTNQIEIAPTTSIACLDAKSGKSLWTKEKAGYFHAGLIRTGDNKVLVLNDSGVLSLLDVDAAGAKELCKAKVCGGTLVNPALAAGRLVVRDDKELICLQLAE
jgi:outer membrane protein assembly factor BamB